jgi:hypothetical protein
MRQFCVEPQLETMAIPFKELKFIFREQEKRIHSTFCIITPSRDVIVDCVQNILQLAATQVSCNPAVQTLRVPSVQEEEEAINKVQRN